MISMHDLNSRNNKCIIIFSFTDDRLHQIMQYPKEEKKTEVEKLHKKFMTLFLKLQRIIQVKEILEMFFFLGDQSFRKAKPNKMEQQNT